LDPDEIDKCFRALEVTGIGGVERQCIACSSRSDHEFGGSLAGLPTASSDGRADLTKEPRCVMVIREGLEGRLHMLQHGHSSRTFERIVGGVGSVGQLS
jgi:hypothetical protein